MSVNKGMKANSWCTFCSGGNSSGKCAVATDPVARKNLLRQKGKCFLCLKASHVSRNCPDKGRFNVTDVDLRNIV